MPDNMTPEQRSRTMSRIRSTNTKPEVLVRRMLHARRLRYRKHVRHLPGNPDIVFVSARVIVLINGDFWHGWRFPQWEHKMSDYWRAKIERNRKRDRRNIRRLRAAGWKVFRVWEHDIEADCTALIDTIESAVRAASRQ